MKKKFSLIGIFLFTLVMLTSCFSQSYVDKINEKAADKDPYTYKEVLSELGTPVINGVVSIGDKNESGIVVFVKGCKTMDEVEDKIDGGKKVKVISVTFFAGKAKSANYFETNDPNEIKNQK